MKILLTGASGFIGKHVLIELLKTSHEIIIISRKPASEFNKYKNVKVFNFDINNQDKNIYKKLGKPDHLIHLAWEGLPNYNSPFHFETVLPNQFMFLKNLIKEGLGSLFITGTCFEYGNLSGSLLPSLNTNPTNPYGFAKDALRRELEFLKLKFDFEFIWARLFYIYGKGQSEKSIYTSLINAVKNGDSVFNMSNGDQLRDYLPVEKVAKSIVEKSLNIKNTKIINICSGKPISVRNLVEKWISENKWNIELNLGFYPYPDYEPFAFWGSN